MLIDEPETVGGEGSDFPKCSFKEEKESNFDPIVRYVYENLFNPP